MAILPSNDEGFKLRSTVDPTDSSHIPEFGMARFPVGTEAENHKILLAKMMDKQLKPLQDVKVLKGTVYSFKNRRIITRWIRDVCTAFGHKSTTFNLAVQLSDCFLIAKLSELAVTHCQLVALAAIWVAAKFEEMDPQVPALQALCDVCDRAYTKDQIVEMEENLLTYFKYCVPHTSAINFLHLFLHAIPSIAARRGDTATLNAAPSRAPASSVEGALEVLIVDTKRHLTITKIFSGLSTSATIAAALTPAVGALLRVAPACKLVFYQLSRTPVRLAKLIPSDVTIAELARRETDVNFAPPLVYCRAETANCLFAERGEWSLLRTPNDDLLRVAEACLREALTNVEFLRVTPCVIGLASLTAALAIVHLRPADVAAVITAILVHVEVSVASMEHFKSATQLIVEKYVEAMAPQVAASVAPDATRPLPCPQNLSECIDATLALLLPKAVNRTTVAS